MPLTSHRSDREFLWLTFGLWLAVYVLHLAPGLASPDGVPGWKAGLLGLCVGLALLLCPLVYLALKRTEGRPYRTRAGATAVVVIAAAAAVSALNAGLYELAYPRFAPTRRRPASSAGSSAGLLLYGSLYGLYATAIALLLSRARWRSTSGSWPRPRRRPPGAARRPAVPAQPALPVQHAERDLQPHRHGAQP
jgi:hypothetical protein